MKEDKFEQENVHTFYQKLAHKFSSTRYRPWPTTLKFYNDHITSSTMLLDSGCGNGRSLLNNHQNTFILDYSAALLKLAKNKNDVLISTRANIMTIPYKDNTFDCILSVAVIHHLSTEERRIEAMREMYRVLKKDGKCLVYMWGVHGWKRNKFVSAGGENDYYVSWGTNEEVRRFYHLFSEDELVYLCKSAGFCVLENGVEQESVFAIIEK